MATDAPASDANKWSSDMFFKDVLLAGFFPMFVLYQSPER